MPYNLKNSIKNIYDNRIIISKASIFILICAVVIATIDTYIGSVTSQIKNQDLLNILLNVLSVATQTIGIGVIITYIIRTMESIATEDRYSDLLNRLFAEHVGTIDLKLEQIVQVSNDHRSDVIGQVRNIQSDIEGLIRSRFSYGLTNVVDGSKLLEKQIKNLGAGDKLRWLDTLVDLHHLEEQLIEAVKRGANIKILLLDPASESAVYRAVDTHAEDVTPKDEHAKLYKHKLEGQKQQVELLRMKIADILKDGVSPDEDLEADVKPKLEINFYDGSTTNQIFIVGKRNSHKFAYTGFFLHKTSENLSHLQWETTSDKPFIRELEEFFYIRLSQATSRE